MLPSKQYLLCQSCGYIATKMKSHAHAGQIDDPPGLRDLCYGPWKMIEQ